jgi:DNA-binding NarL/FixJ family response regulator
LIADDHVMVVAGLASIIGMQPDMEVVGEVLDGRQAVEMWRQLRPDVILLDLRMPHLDGIGALEQIRQLEPGVHSIVLTTFYCEIDAVRAINAGAKGYLLKDLRREDLLDCIRTVDAGGTCIPPDLAEKVAAGIGGVAMPSQQLEVLTLLAQGRSNKEIGEALSVSELAVSRHVQSIFGKLNVGSRPEAICEANRRGLI